MKKTFFIPALAIGLLSASCGNRTDNDEIKTDMQDTMSAPSDHEIIQNADSTFHSDSSGMQKDTVIK